MIRARLLTLFALLVLAGQPACSEHEFPDCDITQRACQVDIYYHVLSLRGDGYDPFGGLPPVTVITEDQFRAQLEQEAAASATSGPSPWDKGLLLLHFTGTPTSATDAGTGIDGGAAGDAGTGSSTIDDEVTHVYAFYDPSSKTVTVISHPNATDSYAREEAMTTLAHELVHALQDREFGLGRTDFTSRDNYFAYDSMIEGDARFYEYMFTNDVRKLIGKAPIDFTTLPELDLEYIYTHFDSAGAPLFAGRLLIYDLGAKYLATAYKSGGNAAVRHAYAKAPEHMVGLLVGSDGRVPTVSSGAVNRAPCAQTLPQTGGTVGADQFGALLVYTFLRGWNVDHATAFTTAQAWTGDYLRVQASTDYSTTAASWRIEFSSDPPASIVPRLTATGELSVVMGTSSLQITATDSTTPLAWLPGTNCP